LVVVIGVGVSTCRIGDIINAPASAILEVDPSFPNMIIDSAAVGSTARRANPLTIKNTGGGELTWAADKTEHSPWLVFQPDSGKAGDPMEVLFDPDSLPVGTYTDTVVITTGAGISKTPVQFTVHVCSDNPIAVDDSRDDTLNSADCGAPHDGAGQFAQLYSFQGTAPESTSIVLSPGFTGRVSLDTAPTATGIAGLSSIPPLATKTDCNGDSAIQCIYYFRLPSTTKYYVEVTSPSRGDTGSFHLRVLHPGRNPNLATALDQRQPDTVDAIQPGGTSGASVLLQALVSDSDPVDSLQIEAEVRDVSSALIGQATTAAPGPKVANGQVARVLITNLTDASSYHWQVRAVDPAGRRSATWTTFPTDPAFTVQTGHNPNPPNATQYQSDGTTVIQPGGTLNGTTIVFKSVVADSDGGNVVLVVEAVLLTQGFTGNATTQSAPTLSGATATATQPSLTDGQDYHWQSWTFDGVRSSPPVLGSTFHVTQAPAQLVFIQQPTAATAGVAIAPAIKVQAQDAQGNPITNFTGTVTLQISNNAGGGTLSGAPPTAAVSGTGTATFSTASIDKTGVGYTLIASTTVNSTVISRISSAFNITPGPISQLAYQVQPPPSTQATSVMTPAIKVAAQDAFQNVVTSFTGNMLIAISTNPSGGTLSGTTTVPAVAGVATFATLSIDKPGVGYKLSTTIPSLPAVQPVVSNAFTITNAPGVRLVFTTNPPPSIGAGVVMTPAIVVTVEDSLGNTITSYSNQVTVTIGSNPGNGTLSGTSTATPVNGMATFGNLSINKVGTAYTLLANGTGATTGTSSAFNITVGPLSQLVFTGQPPATTTAGVAITPAVQVSGEDQFGNVVTSFTGSVTMGFATNPSGGSFTLASTTMVSAVSGVAQFSNLHIRTAGPGYSLQATTPGIPASPASNTFTITPAPAASLVFTNQPGNPTTAGVVINSGSGGVVVTARDSVGNVATSFNSNVTMAASGAGTTLTGTTMVPAASGVAPFTNLRIRTPVGLYTLQASAASLPTVSSSAFNIVVGPATRDTFNVQPATTAVLDTIQKAIGGMKVWITDSIGNLVTTDNTHTVTMTLFSGPSATLSGTKVKTAVAGVATFADLTLDKLGTYTLNAVSNLPGNPTDISVPFDIIPGPAKTLVFKVQPPLNSTVAGQPITPAVQVAALDVAGDTATGFTGNVTMSLNPSGGGIGGTTTVAAVAGIATFSNLTVTLAGNYTLTASATGVTSGTSNSFTVQPGGVSVINSTIVPSTSSMTACKNPGCSPNTTAATITVTAKDAGGNPVPGQTVVLSTNGNGDNITQPAAVTDAFGVASGTITDTTVEILTVRATIGGTLINAAPTVSVSAAAPAVLAWLGAGQPRDTTAGAALRAPGGLQVRIQDQFHNNVPGATNPVGISILIPPSPNNGATLLGAPNPKAAVNGVATFTNLSIDKVGTTYALLATGLPTTDTSVQFAIRAGAATQLSITTQPSTSAQSGIAIPQQPAVQLLDAFNNPVNQSGVVVTAALATGSGSLTNATMSTDASGLATFSGLAINGVVGSYTLKFTTTSPSLTSPNSNSISLSAGAASKLGFFTQPVATTGGVAIPATVQVEIEDASGNRVTSASATIQMALGTNPKNGHLTGTTSAGTASGVASFSNLVIDSAATGYTLSATGGGFTGATSSAFNVGIGSATKLGFRIQPANTGGGATMATVQVEIRDAGGNRVTSGSRNVSLTLSTNPNNGTLSGTINNVASSAGLANFTDLSIDSAASGYVLQATAAGGPPLTSANSNSFNIFVGPAARLIYLVEPADPQSDGVTVTPPVQVEVADLGGNRVTSSNATIAIDFGNNPGGSPLGGTVSKQATAGLVSFDDLVITGAGSGYTLIATSSGLTGTGPSNPFTVN